MGNKEIKKIITKKPDAEKEIRQHYNVSNNIGDLPSIAISKKRILCESEVESFDILISSYNIEDCYYLLPKVKKMFNIH